MQRACPTRFPLSALPGLLPTGRTALRTVCRGGHHRFVRLTYALLSLLLRSPLHRSLSGKVDVVRYRGLRSGRQFSTPTQHVPRGDEIVILVGRPETKAWWKNFRHDHDVDRLPEGRWVAETGRLVLGLKEPETASGLCDAYLAQHPKAIRGSDGATGEERARRAVLVLCRPR